MVCELSENQTQNSASGSLVNGRTPCLFQHPSSEHELIHISNVGLSELWDFHVS